MRKSTSMVGACLTLETGKELVEDYISTTGTGTIVHVCGYDGQNSSCSPP